MQKNAQPTTLAATPDAERDVLPRLHELDALRLFFMLLGIPYHAALVYSASGGWLIKSPSHAGILTAVAAVLHSFRMTGFFLLAGFFASLVIRRQGVSNWLRAKSLQLLLPLGCCLVLLTPPQIFLAELAKLLHPIAQWDIAWRATIRTLSRPGKLWVLHLWFLIDLFLLCCALALMVALRRLGGSTWSRGSGNTLATRPRLAEPALVAALLTGSLIIQAAHRPLELLSHILVANIIQIGALLYYGLFFFAGVTLEGCRPLFNRFTACTWRSVILLALIFAALIVLAGRTDHLAQLAVPLVEAAGAVVALKCLLAVFQRYAYQPSRLIRSTADAGLTVYLVHHPIVEVLAFACVRLGLAAIPAWTLMTILATIASLCIHRFLVRPSPVLTLLLNGRRARGRHGLALAQSGAVSAG